MSASRYFLAAAVLLSLMGWARAETQETKARAVKLDIASQPLDEALNQFAQQAGLQLVYHSRVAKGFRAPRVVGTLSPQAALSQLLGSTGLTYEYLDADTVRIFDPAGVGEGKISALEKEGKGQGDPALWLAQVNRSGDTQSAHASAPQAAADSSGEDSSGRRIEEIIVTAQKRSERLLDTPQSVSVLSEDALFKLGAVQFRDFASSVPGLNFTTRGAGDTVISLRGVTTGTATTSPTVGTYVDEVPYGTSGAYADGGILGLDVGLFDLERIEVLRGPQGTLYGASTMGGLIKYVTKRPDARAFGVDARTGISSTEEGGVSYNGSAALNMPLATDRLALRASGFYSHDGGYIDNLQFGRQDIDRSNVYGGRLDFLLTPVEALTVRVTGFAQNISRDGEANADYGFTSGLPLDDELSQRRLLPEPFDHRFRLLSGTVTYDAGPAMLTSVSSYQTSDSERAVDLAPLVPVYALRLGALSAVDIFRAVSTDKFVQELRLASSGSRRLEWLVGGFYTRETSGNIQDLRPRTLTGQVITGVSVNQFPSHYEEYAGFGDLTWRLTEKFDVTGGVRYAQNRQSFQTLSSGPLAPAAATPIRRSSEDVFTYLANARYRFNERATGYVRYATGYRPGGPNFLAIDLISGLPVASDTFESDTLKSYEVGLKAESGDRRFGIDVAAYYIDWSNIQISVVRGTSGVWSNAPGGAEVRGAELTLTARPLERFTMTGGFSYVDAVMSAADTDLRAAKGERLPTVPRFTAAVNADYAFGWRGWQPTIGASLQYKGDRTASFDASPNQFRMPDYTTLDLRAGFTLDRVDMQIYVRNLFDERGMLSVFPLVNEKHISILQPRTFGIAAVTRF